MRMESCCNPKKDKRAKSARPFCYKMSPLYHTGHLCEMGGKNARSKCQVTLTFDLWPPKSNQFLIQVQVCATFEEIPAKCSWDIMFTRTVPMDRWKYGQTTWKYDATSHSCHWGGRIIKVNIKAAEAKGQASTPSSNSIVSFIRPPCNLLLSGPTIYSWQRRYSIKKNVSKAQANDAFWVIFLHVNGEEETS